MPPTTEWFMTGTGMFLLFSRARRGKAMPVKVSRLRHIGTSTDRLAPEAAGRKKFN
jgi:hypothetical protein